MGRLWIVRAPGCSRVTTRLNVGGPARQAIFLTDALRARGYDTRLVWGASGPAEGTIDPPADLPHTYLPWLGRDLRPRGRPARGAGHQRHRAALASRRRPHPPRQGGRAGPGGGRAGGRARRRAHLPRARAAVLLLADEERRVRTRRAGARRAHRRADRGGAAGARRAPRARDRDTRTVARGAGGPRPGGVRRRPGGDRRGPRPPRPPARTSRWSASSDGSPT